jgi:hypothetical protein
MDVWPSNYTELAQQLIMILFEEQDDIYFQTSHI